MLDLVNYLTSDSVLAYHSLMYCLGKISKENLAILKERKNLGVYEQIKQN